MADIDVSPGILEQMNQTIEANDASKRARNRLIVKAEKGQAGYKDAYDYAGLRGKAAADAIREIEESDLPNGRMYFNIADKTIRPVLEETSDEIFSFASQLLENVNEKAGIHLKPVLPDPEETNEKIKGILDLASGDEHWNEVREETAQTVENFSKKCVDDHIQANAEWQYEVGLSAKVVRTASRGACVWCEDVAGSYEYAAVKGKGEDVWRRHANCNCVIEYEPVKGKRQTVSSGSYRQNKDSLSPEERERRAEVIFENRYHGLEPLSRMYINSNEQLYKNMKKVKPEPGFEDFVVHGKENSVIYTTNSGIDTEYTAKEFADILRADPEYHGGDIRLLSCHTGQSEGGFADQLARELGVKVKAPTEILWTRDQDGEMFITNSRALAEMWYDGENVNQTGTWIVFPIEGKNE